MASRLLNRSKTLTLITRNLLRPFPHVDPIAAAAAAAAAEFVPPLHSRSSLGKIRTSDPKSVTSEYFLSPAVSSLLISEMEISKKMGGIKCERPADHDDHLKEKEVTCFSPLEAAATKPRNGILHAESLKIKRTEQSINITYALIPPLLLLAKTPLTTSLLIFNVYWQIYGFFKEIFLDYVHQEVTREWVLIYFKVLLLILAKDTLIFFGLF